MSEVKGSQGADVRTGPGPSKLSPENQAFIGTPEFQERFGNSAVTDPETGEPQLWYHGTNRWFADFKHPRELEGLSNFGMDHDSAGTYLIETPEWAATYADPLGFEFAEVMQQTNVLSGGTTYESGFRGWNQFVEACAAKDGAITVSRNRQTPGIPIAELDAAVAEGRLRYGDFLQWGGKSFGLVGEFVQLFGGRLPEAADELVSYRSLNQLTQTLLDKASQRGRRLLIPERALPRVIPVFVRAQRPQTIGRRGGRMDLDGGFYEGIQNRKQLPEIDMVIVDGGADSQFGRSALVFEPSQLIPAPSL